MDSTDGQKATCVILQLCVCVCVCVCPAGLLLSSNTLECCYGLTPQTDLKHTLERSSHFCSTHTHTENEHERLENSETHGQSLEIMESFYSHTHTHTQSYRWRLQQVSQMMNLSESPYENTSCSAVTPTRCRFDLFEVNYRKSVYDDVTQPFDRSVVEQEAPHNLTNTKGDDHGLIWREWNAEGAQTFCMDEFSQRMNPDKSGEFTTFPPLVSEMSRQVPWNLAQIRTLPSGWIIKLCWSSEFICDHILEDILIDLSCSAEV